MENVHFESLYPSNTRFNEIEQIFKFIKEGKSCQLIALPGVGKSNVLRLLPYNRNARVKHLGDKEKWFHFVYFDFSQVRKKPLAEVEKLLFLNLIDSLKERKTSPLPVPDFAGEDAYEKAYQIFKDTISFNDELVLFQGLKKVIDLLAIEKELNIVFLLDRFEEYIPMLTPEFFQNLRVLRNRAKYRFSAVFSLNRPLEDLIEPLLFSDFYEFLIGNIIFLPLFDKAGFEFRLSYLEKVTGQKIDKKLVEEILQLTAGHGKLTRLSLEAIPASGVERLASGFLLDQNPVKGALLEIWNSLTPSEQSFLASSSAETRLQGETNYLENSGLLKNGKITIPLFESFLKSNLTIQQFNNSTIIFDSSTNQIKKGNLVLSDRLTSSEFKLLRFFMENKDRILCKEEIINAVWSDTKSTEGVTDQALDQLVFRLRKKIEEDPNSPRHIQTVKGRGIKFNT